MKRSLFGMAAAALLLVGATMAAPAPAKALDLTANNNPVAVETGNILFGWTDFGKSWYQSTRDNGVLGFVTGPITGGANVLVRYVGVVVDPISVATSGKSITPPPVLSGANGPQIDNPPLPVHF